MVQEDKAPSNWFASLKEKVVDFLTSPGFQSDQFKFTDEQKEILAAAKLDDYNYLEFNIETRFNQAVRFQGFSADEAVIFNANIDASNQTLDLTGGELIGVDFLSAVTTTEDGGITIGGTTQNPIITNADPGSGQNIFKIFDINGTNITAGSNQDTITFKPGGSVSLSADGNTVTISSSASTDADTLDDLDSLQFLRSDTSDSFTSGTLSFSNTTLLDLSAITHASSAPQGLLLPQATSLTAITGGTEGYLAWDSDDNELQVFDGTAWSSIGGNSILSSIDSSGVTSSFSGLELSGAANDEVSLIQGCSNGELLKWNEPSGKWECSSDLGSIGAIVTIQENDTTTYNNISTLDYINNFTITESPIGEVNVDISDDTLDFTEIIAAATLDEDTSITFGSSNFSYTMGAGTAFSIIQSGGSPLVTYDNDTSTVSFSGVVDITSAVFQGSSPLSFEGATPDAWETTLALAEPTADNTITLPNDSGTILLDNNGLSALTTAEVDQLENIGANSISAAEWGYLASLNQDLATTSAPTFATINTGQGAYELYAMDQNVRTTDSPTFVGLTLTGAANFQGAFTLGGANPVTAILDEDTLVSDSATALATQQSIKAYVDAQIAGADALTELTDTNISSPQAGHVIIYDGVDSWDNKALSGDVTINSSGVTTIGTDTVALTTDTTGNYVASITAGAGLTGDVAAEGATPTLAVGAGSGISVTADAVALGTLTADWSQTGAFDIVLGNASSELRLLESAGGTYYGTLDVGDLAADAIYTLSGATGTIWTSGNDGSGSTLDADLLDNISSASFLRSDVSDAYSNGTLSFSDGTLLDLSAIIHDDNSPQGLKLPQTTTAGLVAISGGGEGYLAWSTDDNKLKQFNGTTWTDVATGGSTEWTLSGGVVSPNATTTDMAVGSATLVAPFSVDESGNLVRIGDGANDANDPTLTFYASDATNNGSLSFLDSDQFQFSGGNVIFSQNILANGGVITRDSGNITLSTTTSGDLSLTSAGELYFSDNGATNIPLTLTDTDLTSFDVGDRAIIDALNYLKSAVGGGAGGVWSSASGKVYPGTISNYVGIGTQTTGDMISSLYVTRDQASGATGKALAIFNQTESQDILTASASGNTRLTITQGGGLRLHTNSYYTGFQPSGSLSENIVYTLPTADASSSNQVLASNASGVLSWIDVSAGSGGFANWVLTGDSGSETIDSTNTVDVAGGTNITTAVTATDTVTINLDSDITLDNVTFNTGGAIRTNTTATNTLLLQAYDVDGAAYTTFGTLTAGNTPTFDLAAAVTIGGNSILDSTDIGSTVQAYDADLSTIAGLSSADSNFIVGSAGGWVVESANTARTSLGLGTGDSPQFTGLTLTGNGDLQGDLTLTGNAAFNGAFTLGGANPVTAILDEDNMASDSNTALATQQSIKAYVDASVGGADALSELTDTNISSPQSGHIILYDGTDSWDNYAVTGDIAITSLGVTTIQTDSVALGTDTTGNYVATITAGAGLTGDVSSEGSTPTLAVGAGSGITVNADSIELGDLTADWDQGGAFDIILNNADSQLSILESVGGTFYGILDAGDLSANRTITIPDDDGTILLDNTGLSALTTAEVNQLENIDTTTISTTQWGYLGALDQGLTTGSAVTFTTLDTGQGAYELYAMDQNVRTSDTPTFASLYLTDNTTASFDLIFDSNSDGTALTSDRTLTFDVNNADRTIDLQGNLTVTGASTINQNVSTTGSPSFVGLTLSGNTLTFGNGEVINNTVNGTIEFTDGTNTLAQLYDSGTTGVLYVTGGISTFNTSVPSAGYIEVNGICLGDDTNCVSNWNDAGIGHWTRESTGVIHPSTLNDVIAATSSATTILTATQTGAFDIVRFEDQASDTTPFIIDQNGNVGIGMTTTNAALDVIRATEQFRIGYNGANYGSFTVDSSGDLILNVTGGQFLLADNDVFNIGGATGVAYNAIGDNTTGASINVDSDDDLYIEGNLEVDGSLYLNDISLETSGSSAITSGAYVIGIFDEFDNSANTTVQAVINDLDAAIGTRAYTNDNILTDSQTVTASLDALDTAFGNQSYTEDNYLTDDQTTTASLDALDIALYDISTGAAGLWTDTTPGVADGITYLSDTTSDFALGGNSSAAPFFFDVQAGLDINLNSATALTVGDGTTNFLTVDATADAGDSIFTFSNPSSNVTTGNIIALSDGGLTSGDAFNITSTSTGLTTGSLMDLYWNPGSSTTATGDLFRIDIGANSTIGNLLAVYDNGSEVFTVSQSGIESYVPHTFSAAGDTSFAYDILMTNQTSSKIETYAPLTIDVGESFENNDLTLNTYGTGDIIMTPGGTSGGNVQIGDQDPSIVFNVLSATDTDFWLGVQDDANNDDNDYFQIGDGTTPGSNIFLTIDTTGNVGIGDATPQALLVVGDDSAAGSVGANDAYIQNDLEVDGEIYIGNEALSGTILGARSYTEDNYVTDSQSFTASVDALDQAVYDLETGAAGLFTDTTPGVADGITYLTDTTSDFAIGGNSSAAPFFFDVEAGLDINLNSATALTVGDGTTDFLTIDATADAADTIATFNNPSGNVTTGNILALTDGGLTSGDAFNITSTSTALTTGSLFDLYWNPASSTTATGDLFKIDIGPNGTIGNLFAIYDNGSDVFTVSQNGIESAVPHSFTAAGDVSIAYDIVLTNQTSSKIESYGPLTIETGESFENNDLTFLTYGTGNIVLNPSGTSGGNVLIDDVDPTIIFDVSTATDTDFWLGVQDDGANDNNDVFQIGDGTTPGTNPFLTIDTNGYLGLGDTSPAANFVVGADTSAGYANGAGDVYVQNDLEVDGVIYVGNEDLAGTVLGDRSYTEDNYVTDSESFTSSVDALDIAVYDLSTGAAGLWTDSTPGVAAGIVYLTDTTSDFALGGTDSTSPFFFDINAGLDINLNSATALTISDGTTDFLTFDATADTGDTLLNLSNPATNITTGSVLGISDASITTGDVFNLTSTSTTLSTGSLMDLYWNPGSATTATGDLFKINLGSNATLTGNVFALYNNGSDLFKVSTSGIESAVPHAFTAAGDTSFSYDIVMTNQTSSKIESYGPLTIEAGESFENNNLTLKTYGTGDLVVNAGGDIVMQSADPALVFDVTTATDTDFWIGVNEDASGDDNDALQIGDGTVLGSNVFLNLETDGDLGIGTIDPAARLEVAQTDAANAPALMIDTEESTGTQNVFTVITDNTDEETVLALNAQGDLTINGDLILNDGGSIKEAGGTAAITLDGSGEITKVGQDTANTNEVLMWDGSKAVWGNPGGDTGKIVLQAEYPGGTISADGSNNSGTMTSDNAGSSNSFQNYYEWDSNQATLQDYDIYVRFTLPDDFGSWYATADQAIVFDIVTEDTSTSNNQIDAEVYLESSGTVDASQADMVSGTAGSWTTAGIDDSELTSCDAAGETCIIKINMQSKDSYYTRIGDITLQYNR